MTRRLKDAEHYEFIWQHPVTGTSVRIRIAHTRDYIIAGTDHIEVETHPPKTTIPITETGYVSHFIDQRQLRDAGGPQKFIEAWMAREGRSPRWQSRDLANRQGDLFAWAAAQKQVAKRGVKVASKRVAAKRPPAGRKAPLRTKSSPK